MIKVYGFPNTRTLRVTWLLEELGLDYEYHLVNMMKGEAHSPDFLAINPGGKVPALEHEGAVLTESAAIVNYLASLKPDAELIPQSAYRRALYDQWCYFAIGELEQPLWTIGKNKFALPKEHRCPEIFKTAEWEFQKALNLLSKGLGGHDYILGDHFSAADVLVAHCLFWGMAFKQPIEQENLKKYLGRVGVRPALSAARNREQSALPKE